MQKSDERPDRLSDVGMFGIIRDIDHARKAKR